MPGVGFLAIEIPPSAHPLASQLSFFFCVCVFYGLGELFLFLFYLTIRLATSATCLCDPITVFYSQLACAVPEFAGTEEMAKFIGVSVWLIPQHSIMSILDTYNDQQLLLAGSYLCRDKRRVILVVAPANDKRPGSNTSHQL